MTSFSLMSLKTQDFGSGFQHLPKVSIKVNSSFLNEVYNTLKIALQANGYLHKCCVVIQFGSEKQKYLLASPLKIIFEMTKGKKPNKKATADIGELKTMLAVGRKATNRSQIRSRDPPKITCTPDSLNTITQGRRERQKINGQEIKDGGTVGQPPTSHS